MLNARIIFSLDGTLISNDYPNLIVGDNDTTTIRISFKNEDGTFLDLRDYAIDCVVVRPDGEKSPSLTLALDYQDPTIAKIKIGNWMTEVSGSDIFTFRLRSQAARELKATGIATLVIGNGNQPADATITDAQLKALQDAISANATGIANNRDEIAKKRDKVLEANQVYTTDELGNQSSIEHSVHPQKGKKTVAVRGETGRLEIEEPENPKDAVNKDYFDYFETFNKMGLLAVGPYNDVTGKIKFIYDADVIDENDISYNADTGILTSKFPKEGYIGGRA